MYDMRTMVNFYLFVALFGCNLLAQTPINYADNAIVVALDLLHIQEDRVQVTLSTNKMPEGPIRFFIPKTVPGTYSEDNYGRYIEDVRAFDSTKTTLEVVREDENTWLIKEGSRLAGLSYLVNDSFDMEGGTAPAPFSPAGTNILEGENFMLNLHGFVGYFKGMKERPYAIEIVAPDSLYPATSLPLVQHADGRYAFLANRYFEVIDNPIQFSNTEAVSFQVEDFTINLSVYSPNEVYDAQQLQPAMERMMRAQRKFLGEISGSEQYTILLYLSTLQQDALGFGALEHHTSTVVVLPEQMPADQLEEAMIDVVSHEFFHTVTPLNIHSEEIQYFDFNAPTMSRHLWMYEGTTEYFANLFQIREGLIDESQFYERLYSKIMNSRRYNDSLSFTEMSSNVLFEPYAGEYTNVYEKGALINMSLDILLRSLSNGIYGVLDLMRELSKIYDADTPFKDEELIDDIVSRTFPEVRTFFETHVVGSTPINYQDFFDKVGLQLGEVEVSCGHFLTDMETAIPFIDIDPSDADIIFIRSDFPLNSFLNGLGAQAGDVIKEINGIEVNIDRIREIIFQSLTWTPDMDIDMTVLRGDAQLHLTGKAGNPTYTETRISPIELATEKQITLRKSWLGN